MSGEIYLVTGGAGFIGSNVVAALSDRGKDVVVCDWLRSDERWRNLAKHEIADLIAPEVLMEWLAARSGQIGAIFHMGAISSTTEADVSLIANNNIRATFSLLQWCTQTRTRIIYASSAATYGDGSCGFDDTFTCEALARLRPLNAYGWSKHVIDRRMARLVRNREEVPPQWVGLKFFNVYGPNEYHKGSMKSVIAQNFARVRARESLRLFQSHRSEYPDGCQSRDFVYVRDCVEIMLWLLDHPEVSGLFNLGTGRARTWLDLAGALFDAAERQKAIEFIPMPPAMMQKYQYFTEARMERLRAAGYDRAITSLEDGVRDYVRNFLSKDDPYR
jgi:ADP-L-glycero-D-manno-heptose 6-epimerase